MVSSIHIGIGISAEKDEFKALKEAFQLARGRINSETINLALVFSSVEFAHATTFKTITAALGEVPFIGCSSAALISHEGIFRNAVAIALLAIPKTICFNIASVKNIRSKTALIAGQELGEKLLHNFAGVRRDFGLVFSDGLMQEGSMFVNGLQEKCGTSFPILGASASDNLHFQKTYTYYNQEVENDSACGIIWGGRLNFGWGMKHGWKPLGKPRRVTRSKDNIVYEIDGFPAAKIYKEYLARDLNQLKQELRRISTFYPIGIHLAGEKEYLLRNVHSIENDGSLVCQGNVPINSEIRLMIGTKESCLEAATQASEESKKGLYGKKMRFALVFDSISRYILLGRDAEKEVAAIRQALGNDIPFIGIYTYGEQAPLKAMDYQGRTYFHNQTVTVIGVEG